MGFWYAAALAGPYANNLHLAADRPRYMCNNGLHLLLCVVRGLITPDIYIPRPKLYVGLQVSAVANEPSRCAVSRHPAVDRGGRSV